MIYGYQCPPCGEKRRRHQFDIWKLAKDSSRPEACPNCNGNLERVFSVPTALTFQAFFDPTYNTEITSSSQERSLMKKHGHINGSEVYGKKYEGEIKNAKRKAKKPHTVRFGKAA